MQSVVITALEMGDDIVEVVERKGLGHPDTICDALAETLSRKAQEAAGIIGIPGRLQLEWVAAFARNPRPTSSECAYYLS